jgi:hypothetical protein
MFFARTLAVGSPLARRALAVRTLSTKVRLQAHVAVVASTSILYVLSIIAIYSVPNCVRSEI